MQLLCIFTPATAAKKQAEEERRRVCWFQPRPDRRAERPNWPSASLCIYPTSALFNAPLPSSRGTEAPGRPPICHLRWKRPGDRLGWGPAFALAGKKNQGEGRETRSTIARVRKAHQEPGEPGALTQQQQRGGVEEQRGGVQAWRSSAWLTPAKQPFHPRAASAPSCPSSCVEDSSCQSDALFHRGKCLFS